MDLNVLKTFVSVCENGGFSAAGEKLGYTQSTVSSQIKQLETELNSVLFDRLRHKVTITQAGLIVLNYSREILAFREKMLNDLHQKEQIKGNIHLAMANSVCSRYFSDDYLEFQKRYPEVKLTITESGTEQMFKGLRHNDVDVVFTLDSHIYDSEFKICGERRESAHFVAVKGHALSKKNSITLREIVGESFILTEKGMSYRRILDEKLAAESLEIIPQLEIDNPTQICEILKKTQAISFLPDFITAEDIARGELVFLPVENGTVDVWTQILIHKNKWSSPALTALIDYYKTVISKK